MSGNLDIHVIVKDGQTVSTFALFEGGQMFFHNDADKDLSVTFVAAQDLCDDPGDAPQPMTIQPDKKDHWKVCDGAAAKELKYTAVVQDALPEDPIVIFESRPKKSPINIFESLDPVSFGGGLIIGLVVSYLIARRMLMRDRPRP